MALFWFALLLAVLSTIIVLIVSALNLSWSLIVYSVIALFSLLLIFGKYVSLDRDHPSCENEILSARIEERESARTATLELTAQYKETLNAVVAKKESGGKKKHKRGSAK